MRERSKRAFIRECERLADVATSLAAAMQRDQRALDEEDVQRVTRLVRACRQDVRGEADAWLGFGPDSIGRARRQRLVAMSGAAV